MTNYCSDSTKAIENLLTSKVNIVDLAGSEKYSDIHDSCGSARKKESLEINKSLFTLRKVLMQLSESGPIHAPLDSPLTTISPFSTPIKSASSLNVGTPRSAVKKRKFVSYRDSVLTWLLKDSLGGNSKIVMLATVSPFKENLEETMLTIRYAQVTKQMVNIVQVNEDHRGRFVRELIAEVARLEKQLQLAQEPNSPLNGMLKSLQQQVVEREFEISNLTKQLKAFVECPKPQRNRESDDTTVARLPSSVGSEEDLLVDMVDASTSPLIVKNKTRLMEMGTSPMALERQDSGTSMTPRKLSCHSVSTFTVQAPVQSSLVHTNRQLRREIEDLKSELFECQTDMEIFRDQAKFYKAAADRANANLDQMLHNR
ncbi:StAR- lipid transfer (START) domain containing 9 [Cichlidogyrus casuarinus]|uniref:Kinesin-like protein n=1 Tax=Cichlidogyrus casuarinus TaxID=1844966 RepID=A0ABD2PX08_9PLAT